MMLNIKLLVSVVLIFGIAWDTSILLMLGIELLPKLSDWK